MNLAQARQELSALCAKVGATVDNPRLDIGRKTAMVDKLEPQIHALKAQIKSLEGVDRQRVAFEMATTGPGGEVGEALHALGGYTSKFDQVGGLPLTVADEGVKSLFDAAKDRRSIAVKATLTSGSPAALYPVQVLPPVAAAREPQRILDLIPHSAIERGIVEYYTTTGTAAAAAVAEGAVKPASSFTHARKTATAVKLAHRVQVTDELLSDFPSFRSLLMSDMVAGVIAKENDQLLNGDGSGANMTGMLATSGIQTRARSTETNLDCLELAITDLRSSGRFVEPDAIVMHPANFSATRRLKDSQNRFLAVDPLATTRNTVWGVPVVVTTQCPVNTAVVANFGEATHAWVREGINVILGYETGGFEANMPTMIAEERIAFGVVAPTAIVKVTNLT